MAEKYKEEIILHNIDPYAVKLLIEFSYTGDIIITADNVQVKNSLIHNIQGCRAGAKTRLRSRFLAILTPEPEPNLDCVDDFW